MTVPTSARRRTGSATAWRRGRLAGSVAVVALLAAACSPGGGDEEETGATTETAAEVVTPQIAFTTDVQPTYVNTWYGPIEFGGEYGFDFSEKDFTVFESHSTGTQALLSGSAQIIGGSFVSNAVLREQGQELQVFCPFNNADTLALVGRNGVDSVEQIFDPATRVATDSPGGAGSMVFNALLEAMDAEGTVDDIPTTQILESSSLRANAFAADQVDVAVIHIRQFEAAAGQVPDGKILATLADDVPELVMQAFAARADWLAENEQVAIDFCATILLANRALSSDYDTFRAAVQEYVAEPGEESVLEGIFEVIERSDIWPKDGIAESAVDYTLGLAFRSGLTEEELDGAEVVNRDILDAAVAVADAHA